MRFRQADVWGGYDGGSSDTVEVEVYAPWLCAATDNTDNSLQSSGKRLREGALVGDDECGSGTKRRASHGDHGHGHGHVHEDGTMHQARAEVERVAVDKEGEESAGQR